MFIEPTEKNTWLVVMDGAAGYREMDAMRAEQKGRNGGGILESSNTSRRQLRLHAQAQLWEHVDDGTHA